MQLNLFLRLKFFFARLTVADAVCSDRKAEQCDEQCEANRVNCVPRELAVIKMSMFAYKSLYENSREVCNVHGLAWHVWRPKVNSAFENLLPSIWESVRICNRAYVKMSKLHMRRFAPEIINIISI